MVSMIKGRAVTLYENVEIGVDGLNRPIYEEQEVIVDNVLIEPASNDAIISDLDVTGKHLSYVLHIPKTDTHDWNDTKVGFYGEIWHTYGDCLIYDEDLTPLDWNKKVKVERYE